MALLVGAIGWSAGPGVTAAGGYIYDAPAEALVAAHDTALVKSATTTSIANSSIDANRQDLRAASTSSIRQGRAAKGVPQLPAGVRIPIGNKKYGLDHIVRRHHHDAVTSKPASKFSRDLGAHGIRRTIRDAASAGGTGVLRDHPVFWRRA